MDSNELQNLMASQIPNMPNKARRVAEYLLSNMREAAFRSIGEVADDLKVSKAQLVRVARILGFKGYSELKDYLQQAILEQINPAAMLAKSVDEKNELPETIFKAEHANLDDTWTQLEQEKIGRFCELVKEAHTTSCLGWGISSLVMEMMYIRLSVMGVPAILAKRGSLSLIEQSRFMRAGALGITCELPSYTVDVTEAVELAYNQGAKIITITDSPAAPVCRFAELSFFVSASSPTFGSSIIAPLFLTHILTSALAVSLGDSARNNIEAQAAFLHDERFFYPIFGLKY